MMAKAYDDSRRARVFSLSLPGGHPKTWNTILATTKGYLTELLKRVESKHEQIVGSYKEIVSHRMCYCHINLCNITTEHY